MTVHRSIVGLIGNTPLLRLKRASDETGCEILGKCEFLNPGQSVKDRPALGIVREAEAAGLLKPGGTIVEGTAGNTGIGLALVGKALGYRVVIVMPRTQSQEKKDAIRLLGAELIEVDAVPYANPNNYVRYSGRLAEELAASEPTARSGPTSSTTRPTAAHTIPQPPRKSGSRPAANWTASSAPSAPAARWAGSPSPSRKRTRKSRSGSLIPAARRSIPFTRPANSRPKAPPSPKASARAASRPTLKASRSTRPTASTMTKP